MYTYSDAMETGMELKEVRWERMFPDELETAIERRPVVYLPYGLCEPHGPQNALGMDALRAHAASRRAAQESGGVVAPPSYWHVHEHGIEGAWACERVGEVRPWLTAVPVWVFLKNMLYHLRAVDALGFHAAVVFSGHAGPFIDDVNDFLSIVQPHLAVRVGAIFGIGAESRFPDAKGSGDHAGRAETSVLWASDPDCVDISRAPPEGEPGKHFAMGERVRESDRRVGEAMLREVADGIARIADGLLAEYERAGPGPDALTFDGVEAVWDEKIRPRIAEMAAMRDVRPDQSPPPEDSVWRRNWKVRYRG